MHPPQEARALNYALRPETASTRWKFISQAILLILRKEPAAGAAVGARRKIKCLNMLQFPQGIKSGTPDNSLRPQAPPAGRDGAADAILLVRFKIIATAAKKTGRKIEFLDTAAE